MQKMKQATLRKCQEAVNLVYEKGYSLRSAAKTAGISSQTLYVYVDDYLSEGENKLVRGISKKNTEKRA